MQNKGYSIQKDIPSYVFRPRFIVINLENEDFYFIAMLKRMKLWFPTWEAAMERCKEVAQSQKGLIGVE